MIQWHEISPPIVALITFLLMWSDWLLSIVQEKERHTHYFKHYQSYPVNTIEGNTGLQGAVKKRRIFKIRHMAFAVILSISVAWATTFFEIIWVAPFLGYVWGLFLIVSSTHLGNIIGYRASRRGLHGKLYLHQRTGLWIQMGRYASLTLLLLVLAICSFSPFIAGVAFAGMTSSLRQFIWLRKVPTISSDDHPPEDA